MYMHVVLTPSPTVTHKYRVLLPNKKTIDIGSLVSPDYTDHGNPRLMRAHLLRKGAQIPRDLRIETDPYEIHRGMLYADTSTEENWDDPFRAGYWERWLLWSYPNVNQAQLWMTMRKNVLFMPTEEMMWFCNERKRY
jgi:hypothetical protein